MAEEHREDQDEEDKVDAFTSEGEAKGYLSLDQAQVLAMRTARQDPGRYGRRFRMAIMAFEVAEAEETEETEDHYVITLSFRPEGEFAGSTGREQFFIEKEGVVSHRQVIGLPKPATGKRRFLIIATTVGLVGVATAVVLIGVIVSGRGTDRVPSVSGPPVVSTPQLDVSPAPTSASVLVEPSVPTPVSILAPVRKQDTPRPNPAKVAAALPASIPTPTPTPEIRVIVLPTATPLPTVPPAFLGTDLPDQWYLKTLPADEDMARGRVTVMDALPTWYGAELWGPSLVGSSDETVLIIWTVGSGSLREASLAQFDIPTGVLSVDPGFVDVLLASTYLR